MGVFIRFGNRQRRIVHEGQITLNLKRGRNYIGIHNQRITTHQDLVGSHKPDPEMIHRCLSQMGVGRDEASYVGDMLLDVESAARAGVPVVLVPGGSSSLDELRSAGQTVLSSFGELPSLLAESAPRGSLSDPPAGA